LAISRLDPYSVEQVTGFIGSGTTALLERAFEARGKSFLPDELSAHVAVFRSLYGGRLVNSTRAYAGAATAISRLREQGVSTAICTNKEESLALSMVSALGLRNHFATIVGGSPNRSPKPSPEPLMEVIARLGASREDVLMVGDSETDVRCARAAGVKIICVSFGYSRVPVHELGADGIIDSYNELETSCRRLRADPT
jgi:phosphoglycolate phosphatase